MRRFNECRRAAMVIGMLVWLVAGGLPTRAQAPDERRAPRNVYRYVKVVVACDPMDLHITPSTMPEARQKFSMQFMTAAPPPEKDREAILMDSMVMRVAWEKELAKPLELSAQQVEKLKTIRPAYAPHMGRSEPWMAEVESLYVAWESAADETSRQKVQADLVAKVKEIGAAQTAKKREDVDKRLAVVKEALDEKQMGELKKLAVDPKNNYWQRYWDSQAANRPKEGVWREEYISISTGGLYITCNRRAGSDSKFYATGGYRTNQELMNLENALFFLASHHDFARTIGVTKEQIGKLRATAVDWSPSALEDQDIQRLRAIFDSWEKAVGAEKQDLEGAMFAMAKEIGDKSDAQYRTRSQERLAEIRAGLTAEQIAKTQQAAREDSDKRSGMYRGGGGGMPMRY